MTTQSAFFSYVHADDERDGGRIRLLASDLADEYEAIAGEPMNVLIDRETLLWGHEWRNRLTRAIADATFLICIVTPRFFQSTECRNELEIFAKIAADLGRSELILPILYIDVAGLDPTNPDAARALVANLQWMDWRNLRFEDTTSGAYRRGVNDLAVSLQRRAFDLPDPSVSAVADLRTELALVGASSGASPAVASDGDSTQDAPGWLEAIAEGIGSLEEMTACIEGAGDVLGRIGEAANEHTLRMINTGNPKHDIANRLHVSAELGRVLVPLADALETDVEGYLSALKRADVMVDVLFRLTETFAAPPEALEFAEKIIYLSEQATPALSAAAGFTQTVRDIGKLSRTLREPSLRIARAVQAMIDTEPTLSVWGNDARALAARVSESSAGPDAL